MNTLSAGTASGLVVALMVMTASEGYGAAALPAKATKALGHPADSKDVNMQPASSQALGSSATRASAG